MLVLNKVVGKGYMIVSWYIGFGKWCFLLVFGSVLNKVFGWKWRSLKMEVSVSGIDLLGSE